MESDQVRVGAYTNRQAGGLGCIRSVNRVCGTEILLAATAGVLRGLLSPAATLFPIYILVQACP
jgi:hypothetical protein